MKWTLLLCDGVAQVNLEPENDHEREVTKILRAHKGSVSIHVGRDIGRCQGGYLRDFGDGPEYVAITITKATHPEQTP